MSRPFVILALMLATTFPAFAGDLVEVPPPFTGADLFCVRGEVYERAQVCTGKVCTNLIVTDDKTIVQRLTCDSHGFYAPPIDTETK